MIGPKPLTVAQQWSLVGRRYPAEETSLKSGRFRWVGRVKPTALSRSYLVEVRYGQHGHPEVRVLGTLQSRDGVRLPHTYSDGTLCLYRPHEWTRADAIADTIIPWASEWLLHYELWLATGEWHGGGQWPLGSAANHQKRRPS